MHSRPLSGQDNNIISNNIIVSEFPWFFFSVGFFNRTYLARVSLLLQRFGVNDATGPFGLLAVDNDNAYKLSNFTTNVTRENV